MIGYWILAVLVAFIAVVAIRTIRFRPKPQPEVTKEEIAFDRDAAVDSLAQLVRCKTVSYNDHSLEDEGEFQKLISLLPTLYPNVFGTCTFQQLPDRALLLRWPGKQEGNPAVMMAHYDVVPVNELSLIHICGQTAINLAQPLHDRGVKIIATICMARPPSTKLGRTSTG